MPVTKGHILYIIPFISHSEKGQIIGKENKSVVVKGHGAGWGGGVVDHKEAA